MAHDALARIVAMHIPASRPLARARKRVVSAWAARAVSGLPSSSRSSPSCTSYEADTDAESLSADCKFAHSQGRTLDIAPPDEEMRDAKHVSERLRRFARAGEGEGEMERIIPGEA